MGLLGGGGPLGLPASLFTHEDPYNLHKVFGYACLLHFIVRLFLAPFSPFSDILGFGVGRPEVPFLICMHSALSLLSLVF